MKSIKIILCILFVTLQIQAQKKKQSKPNVLLIYTDDHRYTGVHALVGQDVKTPNIDKLANEGLIFTNTYLMGSYNGGTCMPSRAQLLTGRRLFDLKGIGRVIPTEQVAIGEAFLNAGYNSHVIGKWHQDNKSLGRMFNSGATIMSRGIYLTDHYRMPLWDWRADGKYTKDNAVIYIYDKKGNIVKRGVKKGEIKGPINTEKDGPHTSEIYANNAIDYIEKNKKEKPFFMYLAFHAPHDPRQAPKKYKDMYPEEKMKLTPSYMEQHPFDNGHMTTRDESLAAWPRTPAIARKELSDYYAIITHLDAQIGRVITSLKKSGQYENTIIVLSGDSGLAVGNHGLMGKQNVYDEDGIHVPFIISGKIKGEGRRIDAFSYIHDIYPTICDVANVKIPESVTGKSLLPVINGDKKQVRDYTYHAYRQHQRAYRKGEYKLIEFVRAPDIDKHSKVEFISGSRTTLLFNFKKDPWETTNLAFLPEYKETLDNMRKEMREKSIELNDYKERNEYPVDFWDYYTD
ncbi:sulfatase-like hydrolase/transferase [Polaribacter sp. Q13]|uniref:sulfatase-like hydrolase/transferase n=1 Tax=Polaribacter sp. Q13 TaxID=2806551 RepID=UPI00193C07EA|nr:sulfatase-like hydrolase/transferase [Polaribacter sp. Q13]QVY66073.1 sulfatase-like hydrolase/transferase [Polaribacter sp. Q13]